MKRICGVLVLCLLAGCASTGDIYKNYEKLGRLENGVNAQQAKIIAQRKLIATEEKDAYRISLPDIKNDPSANKYPGYWFVVFGHNWLEPLSNDALTASYTDLREKVFLVVIDKKTAEVPFVGEWFPQRENDFDWVFHPRAYNKKDPLTLPPGKQSKEVF